RRKDDEPEVVRTRYQIYKQTFEPVIQYYRGKGILAEIDASRNAEEVVADIERVLRERGIVR
ncbi:MAG: adenylate kinase, partial [Ignisphaera sp.]